LPDMPLPSVCLVTAELVGPSKNGGIGTATTGLAVALARAGHEVTVYFTRGYLLSPREVQKWRTCFARLHITFRALRPKDLRPFGGQLYEVGYVVPAAVLSFLEANRFEIVHFNDTGGEGFLALTARQLGIFAADCTFILGVHSPTRWIVALNRDVPVVAAHVAIDRGEWLSIAASDLLWSPSRYMLDWARAAGYPLPDTPLQRQYVIPRKGLFESREALNHQHEARGSVRAIVFFGRLEERKGLRLFLSAIDRIAPVLAQHDIGVVFLGRLSQLDGQPSDEIILNRARAWNIPVEIKADLDQQAALEFLGENGRLAVIASPADNSPCTVYEVIENGIPFLAASTGGIPELISPADRELVLFHYTVPALVAALERVIKNGAVSARSAVSSGARLQLWLDMHRERTVFARRSEPRAPTAGLIVLVEDFGSDAALRDTLSSLNANADKISDVILLTQRAVKAPAGLPWPITVADPHALFETLDNRPGCAVLALRAGIRIEAGAVAELLHAVTCFAVDGLAPSARTSRGEVIHTVSGALALAFIYGPAEGGAILLGPNAVERARRTPAAPDTGPFGGIADRALVGGARIWPYPKVLVSLPKGFLRRSGPVITAGRIELYAGVGLIDREQILTLAAVGRTDHLTLTLKRKLALWLLRSRIAPLALLPLVRAIVRAISAKLR